MFATRDGRGTPDVVVVTGASSGIGCEIAKAFAKRGARLVLNGRSIERLDAVAEQCRALGGEVVVAPGDVIEPAVRRGIVDGATEHFGGIDVLVNNAGVGLYGAFESIEPKLLRDAFELNVVAPLALTQAALPALRKRGGTIVMVSSISGLVALPRMGGYSATKFALEALTMSLRAEVEAQGGGVRVLSLRPGLTDTPFPDNAFKAEGGATRGAKLRGMSAEAVAEAAYRAVVRGDAELNLTMSGRTIAAVARVSRPALRAVLRRIAPRVGLGAKVPQTTESKTRIRERGDVR